MSANVGDPAPDFKLKSQNLEDVALGDFRGKKNVVLLFFPFVNTSTCEKELCSTRDNLSKYESLDAQILAISVDSPFAQKLWAEKHNFSFPLLSDFNKEVAQNYNSFYDVFVPGIFDYSGVAKRSAFVIDMNGIIRYAEILEDSREEPDYVSIQSVLKQML